MSVLYKNFATDANVEAKGFWFLAGLNDDETAVRFLLARKGKRNIEYVEMLTKKLAPYQVSISNDTVNPKVLEAIILDVFISTILKGWENVYGSDNKILPYNKDNARKLMRELPDLYDVLNKQAEQASNYHDATVEKTIKN